MEKNFIGLTFGKNYKLVVSNAKEVYGHDDSTPFNADFEVFKDGKLYLSGKAWNDGWGGPSCINFDSVIEGARKKEEELDNVCESIFTWSFKTSERTYNMSYKLIDIVEQLAMIAIYHPKNKGIIFREEAMVSYIRK